MECDECKNCSWSFKYPQTGGINMYVLNGKEIILYSFNAVKLAKNEWIIDACTNIYITNQSIID